MFCPECGQPQTTAPTVTEPAAVDAAGTAATAVEPVAAEGETPTPSEVVVAAANSKPIAEEPPANEPGSHPGARERTKERLHRASTAARGAIGDNVKRVEKIHHASTAMFEEAHYDPSLRFVLVALGLFLVFVILLVLSKVMG
ncbi:MAG: hypothetical protein QOH71_2922 [Blastocatellia bacterium]|nr:hypothetical protein [Blastocatellia bacterium]